jgi:hypothetical protein
MTWNEALERSTDPHRWRYAQLCGDDNPDVDQRDAWRARVVAMASPPPSLGRQLANAGMAAGRVVAAAAAGRPVVAPSDVIAARVAVCDECPEWVGGRCRVCGCGGLKRHLTTERCPLGKWPA